MITKKKSRKDLERDNERLRKGVQVDLMAFRNSAEIVLNQLIRGIARAQIIELAATSQIKSVAYGTRSAFEAKQWCDNVADKICEFNGTHMELLEFLEIDDAEAVYDQIEKDIARNTNEYAIKMFTEERHSLQTLNKE